jgi:uncharacterized protein YidB (DUF937 family)
MGLLEQILGSVLAKSGGSQSTGGLDDLLGRSQGSGGLGDLLGGSQGGGGGLGDLLGGVLGGGGGGARSGGANLLVTLLPLILMMLQKRGGNAGAGGGLGGLLQQLQAAGLGHQADSWVGSGDNEPVTAEQLRNALGPDSVHELAMQAGVSDEEASGGLAALLPELVHQLTPEGRLPADEGGQVDTALADLRRSLGM